MKNSVFKRAQESAHNVKDQYAYWLLFWYLCSWSSMGLFLV